MKKLDLLVWALLAIGGLNWGLVGFFNFNLVSAIFGDMSVLSRLVYALVGLAALYDIVMIKAIFTRWNMHIAEPAHT